MIVIRDEVGFVAAFPQRAGTFMRVIDIADVVPTQCLHQAADRASFCGRHQQMDVVGHQYIGMHAAFALDAERVQVLQVAHAVDIAEAAWLPIVAALDDVLCHACRINSWSPCHVELQSPFVCNAKATGVVNRSGEWAGLV